MTSSAVETRLNTRISEYFDLMKKGFEEVIERVDNITDQDMLKNFMNSIKPFSVSQDDLLKRKRVKNIVPYFDRCLGKKSNATQCTRRIKDGNELCGTHIKGTPHGRINDKNVDVVRKVNVYAKEINGIVYYIDNDGNVYDTEDVYQNKHNPKIIAKYKISEEDETYTIQNV